MILDPESLSAGDLYRWMISVIVPRPIAFISTVSEGGRFNVAPFSYFVPLTNRPPLLGISINQRAGGPKDTLRNLRATGDFVVNIVDETLIERMVKTSGEWPEDVSEFELTGLTPVPSDRVKAPRVGESPVSMECRVYREVPLGDTTFVVGELLRAHMADDRLTDGRVDIAKLKPIGRLGGDAYSRVRDDYHLQRPKVERPGRPA